jgi:hypothetical protein
MKKNMGTIDIVIRVLIAVVIAVLFFTKVISGWLAIVLLVIAVAFIITSIIGFCPIYLPFKIDTRKKE